MSGQLLLFKPPFAFGGDTPAPSGATRTHPLVLDPLSVEDTLELTVPDGITFDELPPAVTLDTTYGRYTLSRSEPDARRVVLTRRLDVPRQTGAAGGICGGEGVLRESPQRGRDAHRAGDAALTAPR